LGTFVGDDLPNVEKELNLISRFSWDPFARRHINFSIINHLARGLLIFKENLLEKTYLKRICTKENNSVIHRHKV